MNKILFSLLALPLIGCSAPSVPISDPVAVPYLVEVQVAPSTTDGTAELKATVNFGGFGSGGPARVEFRNGTEVLAATSERTPTTSDPAPQQFTYKGTFTPTPKTAYQIRAVVTWDYGSFVPRTLESSTVSYP